MAFATPDIDGSAKPTSYAFLCKLERRAQPVTDMCRLAERELQHMMETETVALNMGHTKRSRGSGATPAYGEMQGSLVRRAGAQGVAAENLVVDFN